MNRLTEQHCACCSRDREKKFFSKSLTTDELFPYCDTCINTKYRQNLAVVGMEEAALWLVCAQLDIPYINEYVKIAKKPIDEQTGAGRKIDFFRSYYNTLRDSGIQYHGFWQSNVMLDDIIEIHKDTQSIEEELDRNQLKMDWGQFSDEDYTILEQSLHEYVDGLEAIAPSQLKLYRDLCKAELRKRKINESESPEGSDIEKATKEIFSLMKILGIDKFDSGDKSDTDRFIDRLIWKIEETEPAEEEDREKYRDIAGFEVAFGNIMRSMRNLIAGTRDYPKIPKEEE